jgi:CHAT domain-containing protein/tetratricopeptide (TPR) repeat protein
MLAFSMGLPMYGQTARVTKASSAKEADRQLLPGVVVEKVNKESGGEKAGLREGDVLLSWSRDDVQGKIESPFDFSYVVVEQQPRGIVMIEGLRNGEKQHWVLGPNILDTTVRPNFSGELSAIYLKSNALAKRGEVKKATLIWEQAAQHLQRGNPLWLRCWTLEHTARLFENARQWTQAGISYDRAIQAATGLSPSILRRLFSEQASAESSNGNLVSAEKHLSQAIKEAQKLGDENMEVERAFFELASNEWRQGKTAKAFQAGNMAISIAKKIAPHSYQTSYGFLLLNIIEDQRDNLVEAEHYALQALVIAEKLDPVGGDAADDLINLGSAVHRRGDFDRAEAYYLRALSIDKRIEAHGESMNHYGRGTAMSLSGLGMLAIDRGDLAKGEENYRRALAIEQEISPGSFDIADTFTALGVVAWARGDLHTAEHYLLNALKIQMKPANRGNAFTNRLIAKIWLGNVTLELGNLDAAERYFRGVSTAGGNLLQSGLLIADALDGLGAVEWKRGHLVGAERYFGKAVSNREKIAPESTDLALSLARLGDVLKDAGALSQAEECYRRALALREKLAPGSIVHAESLATLAMIMRKKGQQEAADHFYQQALDALENQTARLGGGNDMRAMFRATHANYYSDYMSLLLSLGKSNLAFNILERSRARTLLEMMAAAHVDVRKGSDPSLLDREHSLRADINAKSDRRIRLIGEKHSDEELKSVEKEIADLSSQYQDVEEQIRATSPAYAALTQPQPLTAKEVQTQILDPNTLLLEYSLGEERSYVFAVTPDSLQAFELPKRAEVEKAARRVYSLLTARNLTVKGETPAQRQARFAKAQADYPHAAAELSKMILEPVASQLQNKRLLIVSDGALAYIPFSTLPEPADANGAIIATAEPLVVNHEIVNLPSASVLAVLRQQELGRKPAPNAVAVMADPVFDRNDSRVAATGKAFTASARTIPQTRSGISDNKKETAKNPSEDPLLDAPSSAGLLTRSATDIGLSRNGQLSLPRLRFTRKEADEIMTVTPEGMGKKAVDFDATRAMATSPELSQYRIVHFATHGLLDSAHPELSGLVFSMVDKTGRPQNGFLELQDIYNLNLPADLVVLSACETGLGKEISGEGLVGLTRGFMYAGASRVVASLWRVSDVGTAELMGAFYASMEKDGLPPAAALRAAQIKLWKQKRWSDPYYWAAFQIQGEWK